MADPVLDEDVILHFLKSPPIAEMANRIQAGAVQALLDLYDRKVVRDEFSDSAAQCVMLYSSASKLMILESMRSLSSSQELTPEKFSIALDELQQLMRVQSAAVINIVERMKLCPTKWDVVH